MAIINGRRIQVPPGGITGQNLIQQVNPGPGRRPVIQQGLAFRPVQPGYTYTPAELFDSRGRPVKITMFKLDHIARACTHSSVPDNTSLISVK